MTGELSKYFRPEVLDNIDGEYARLVRRHVQQHFMLKLLARGRPIIGSDHTPNRDRQNHQKWPAGAVLSFSKQEVVRSWPKHKHQ